MIGQIIRDRYRVLSQVSEDRLATTYLATDQARNQEVLLKVIRSDITTPSQFLERFRHEADALERLASLQVLNPLDYGQVETSPYVVFEHVEGQSLTDLCRAEKWLPLEQALGVARQVGLCLVEAHAHQLVHRNLRSNNILLVDRDEVKVMDFGLARGVDLGRLIAQGELEADSYHSPELVAGEEVDGRADLYSLGAILFEMLTGEAPPRADTSVDDGMGRRPSRLKPDVPPEVDDLVARCLSPDPKARPQSAAEFLEGVDEAVRGITASTLSGTMSMVDGLAGQTLGPYRMIEKLGRGGMATVYKAYEPSLDRYVAVKVLPPHFAHDPTFLTRFRREAKAIAKLNHQNIVPVYSFGEQEGLTYIVMRYVETGTLKDLMGRPMALERAIKIVSQIARALGYAHGQGVVHRDVKPANVLMAEGDWPLLSDFGLARMVSSSIQLTQSGVGVGTPAYMSPEQGQGMKVDGRSDIYSLGIMLYEMLTGQVPFQADTPMAIVLKHITAPLPVPRQINPNIPESVERVILKAMAKDPAYRYQTAEEMVEALEKVAIGLPVEAPPVPDQAMITAEITPTGTPLAVAEPSTLAGASTATDAMPVPERKLRIPVWVMGLIGVLTVGGVIAGATLSGLFSREAPETEVGDAQRTGAPAIAQAAPTPTTIPVYVTEGALGAVLFEDSFDGTLSSRWQFFPQTWEREEVDGRTVLHNIPVTERFSGAELRNTSWQDYAVQFDFHFWDPGSTGVHFLYVRTRLTNCPPTVEALQAYVLTVTPDKMLLEKERCVENGRRTLAESDRDLAVDEWHTLQMVSIGNRIQVLVDGQAHIDYIDQDEPFQGGDVIVETESEVEFLLDNFRVVEIIPGEADSELAVSPTPSPVEPVSPGEPSPDAREVQPCQWDDRGPGLCIFSSGDDTPTRILVDAGLDMSEGGPPSWSPDGRQIAFSAIEPGERGDHDSNIYIVNADGTGLTELPQMGNDVRPAWSPDGEWVAFHSSGDLASMQPDGSDPTAIWRGQGCTEEPQWSPDSQWIAVIIQTESCEWDFPMTREVRVISRDGSAVNTVATMTHENGECVWSEVAFSPNGKQVAYNDANCMPWMVNADGSGQAMPLESFPFWWRSTVHPQWGGLDKE